MHVAGIGAIGGEPYMDVVTPGPGITAHSGLLPALSAFVGTLNSA